MRKYHTVQKEEQELEAVVCDCCGKKIAAKNGIATEDFLHIRKEWGYFSRKDGDIDEFDICEDCFERWVQGFTCHK